MTPQAKGAVCGLIAAALFGISVPLTKRVLPGISPLLLAALFYAGAGLGLMGCEWAKGRYGSRAAREAALRRADWPLLMGVVCIGGVAGPLLMLSGLQRLSGTLASLLLNLETPLTILLAVGLFREHLTRQEAAGLLLVLLGAGFVGYLPFDHSGDPIGLLALSGAALCWPSTIISVSGWRRYVIRCW